MKKLILLPLLLLTLRVEAGVFESSELAICHDNGWHGISAIYPLVKNYRTWIGSSVPFVVEGFCVLPDDNYYSSFSLHSEKDKKFKHLFDQYSGQSPNSKQIQKAKRRIKKEGYIVD